MYDDSVAHLTRIAVDRSADDGLYAEDKATLYVSDSLILRSGPIALNATGGSRIIGRNLALYANAADTSSTGVTLEGTFSGDPLIDGEYLPLPGSPIKEKCIGPRTCPE